jgi:hypothetical protein
VHPELKPGDRFGRSTAITATTRDHGVIVGAANVPNGYRYWDAGYDWLWDGALFNGSETPGRRRRSGD